MAVLQGTVRFHHQKYRRIIFQKEVEKEFVPALCSPEGSKKIEAPNLKQQRTLLFYLMLSIIGAVLIILISLLRSPEIKNLHLFDRMFVGMVFIFACIFGFSLALNPNWIHRFVKRESNGHGNQKGHVLKIKRQGHHPDCEPFEGHTITINNKVRCAGCTGLALGSIASIVMMVFFIVSPNEIPPALLYFLIFLGMFLITFNYLVISMLKDNARLHLISNTLLVIGFLFIVIGVFEKTGSIAYSLLTVLLSFLWLDTRIQLSDWRHSLTCKCCGKDCQVY